MTKVNVLSIISVGLLTVNLVLIWFIVSHKPPHRGQDGPKNAIIEKLGFDDAQIKSYEILIEDHKEGTRKLEERNFRLKNQLYSTLSDNNSGNATDSLIALIGEAQIELEQINYRHFQEIKLLCNVNQLEAFNQLSIEIADLFGPKRMPNKNKP